MLESNKCDLEALNRKGTIMGTVSKWQSYRRFGTVRNPFVVATKLGDRVRRNT
jgi:hypothetical protein